MSLYSISTDDAALVATTEKTFIRLNVGSGRKGILRELTVTDALAGATDQGIAVRVVVAGSDGTGTAFTPNPVGNASAANSTAKVAYSAEPTGTTEAFVDAVPAGASKTWDFWGDKGILVAASGAIAIALKGAQARASGVVAVSAVFEEL